MENNIELVKKLDTQFIRSKTGTYSKYIIHVPLFASGEKE